MLDYYLPRAPDSLVTHQFHFKPAPSLQLKPMADQLNIEVSDTMNDEDLNAPVTITKGQLDQLSLASNNCQAMAE